MRRSIFFGLVLGLLAATSPVAARQQSPTQQSQQPTDSSATLELDENARSVAGSYWTFGGLYYAENNNYDLMAFVGQSWPLGRNGGWTMRAGLGAGISFYGYNDAGALSGLQVGLERVLTGDIIQLRNGEPLEIYAVVGGGAYAGWKLQENPEGTQLVPVASAGIGVRWRGGAPHDPMVRLELYREERFSGFDERLYLRFDYLRPRGVQPPPSPPPPVQP